MKFQVSFAAACVLLPALALAREFHVSPTGKDGQDGTSAAPLRTIQAAAELAQPGDTITVHEGIYRERVNPPRGGLSEDKRIVYQSAPGEKAEIRGSELVTGWVADGKLWKVTLPNGFFGTFNPYATLLKGDWFEPNGREHHAGAVYLNGQWLMEAASLEELQSAVRPSWFARVDDQNTTLWVRCGKRDPNTEIAEINVRETVFYPNQPGCNFITVRGFIMRHAGPKWAPPTAEQMGLIGTHWSKGWIIEENTISHSRTVGLSLGKYGDEFDNFGISPGVFTSSVDRAINSGKWSRENIGGHLVQRNAISFCEQAGIVGNMGGSFSRIVHNRISNIYMHQLYGAAETAAIKLHGAIDTAIENNRIHNANRGIWLCWISQGARVSRNLLYDNGDYDLFVDGNLGPILIDNNLFLSRAVRLHSQGLALVHNLFAGELDSWLEPTRTSYVFQPHSTGTLRKASVSLGDHRFYNNLFIGNGGAAPSELSRKLTEHQSDGTRRIGRGLWIYDDWPTPPQAGGNLYYDGARPHAKESGSAVSPARPAIQIEESAKGVLLKLTLDPPPATLKTTLVTSELLGRTALARMRFEEPSGEPIRIGTDFNGKPRSAEAPTAGPFENPGSGPLTLKVW